MQNKLEVETLTLWPLRRDQLHMRQLESWTQKWRSGPESFWDFDAIVAMLARPICRGLVMAQSENAPWAGVIFVDVGNFSADLLYIFVPAELRTRGVAAAMMRSLIQKLKLEPQLEDLLLEVRPSNLAAIKLYQQCGFAEVGRRKKYYSNGEDALVFSLNLKSKPVAFDAKHES